MGARHMGGKGHSMGKSKGFMHERSGGLSHGSGSSDQLGNLGKHNPPRIIGHMKG